MKRQIPLIVLSLILLGCPALRAQKPAADKPADAPKADGKGAEAPNAQKPDDKGEAKEGENEAPKKPEPRRGLFHKYQCTQRMFKKPKDYFKKAQGDKQLQKYYEKSKYCYDPFSKAEGDPEKLIDYNIEEIQAVLYVPAEYDASAEWGIYLYISPDKQAMLLPEWAKIMKQHKLLFLCPYNIQDGLSDVYRMAVALDALATVESEYPIGPGNVIVSGEAKGAAVATMLLMCYPEHFRALICQGWGPILSRTEYGDTVGRPALLQGEKREYWNPETPGIGPEEHRKVLRSNPRIVLFNGFRTGIECERLLRAAFTWARYKYDYLVLDQPDARGFRMPTKALDVALQWIRTGEKPEDLPEPRYDLYEIRMPAQKSDKD